MDVHLLELPWEGGPFGAKGIGELPMDGGAPAVAAAIENATAIAVDELPATPERLHEWRSARLSCGADMRLSLEAGAGTANSLSTTRRAGLPAPPPSRCSTPFATPRASPAPTRAA